MTIRRPWAWMATLLTCVALLGQTGAQGTPIPATPAEPGVVREVLSRGVPIEGGGDAFVEPEGVMHFGRSGSEPVVILVASLFDPAQPPALLVTPVVTPAQ